MDVVRETPFAQVESLEQRQLLSAIAITGYPLPTGTNFPQFLTVDASSNVWFSCQLTHKIGYITQGGQVKLYDTSAASTHGASGMTIGPDGNIWFDEHFDNLTARLNPKTGKITKYKLGMWAAPDTMTVGPDGNIWIQSFFNKIGRLTPRGTITWYPHKGKPLGKIVSFNRALYFAEGNQIGRISTSGAYTGNFALPSGGSVQDMNVGPDGNLWFTEKRKATTDASNFVGYLTPGGTVKEFPIDKTNGDLSGIAASGANLYVRQGDYLLGVSTQGTVFSTQYIEFIAGGGSIVGSHDGNLWFAEGVLDKIGQATIV